MTVETKYLEKLKNKKTLVNLYTDEYEDSDYGFIVDFNDEFLILEKFDSESYPDGLAVYIRENITRVRWGGNEITSASLLIDNKLRMKNIRDVDLSSMETILRSISEIYGHITVHIQDFDQSACFCGEIQDIDSDSIVINEFGSKSALDRKCILLSMENITRVDAEGQYEKNLKMLFQERVSSSTKQK